MLGNLLLFLSLLLSFGSGFNIPSSAAHSLKQRTRLGRFLVQRHIFLTECQLRGDAWEWAKETSRTNRPKPCVLALYDQEETCVYVGMHFDSALAVGHMVKKHGKAKVSALREEPFPPEVSSEPFGVEIMQGLVKSWLVDISGATGPLPVGNVEEKWADFDPNESPFIVGAIGDGSIDVDDVGTPKDVSEMSDGELLDMRREKLFISLNEAMKNGDEETAAGLMKRLNKLGGRVAEAEEE